MPLETGGFAASYGVQLLCRQAPELDMQALLGAVREYCPAVEPMDPGTKSKFLGFAHPTHSVRSGDGRAIPQTVLLRADRPISASNLDADTISQSWSFPDVRERLTGEFHCLLVTDMLASWLPYKERLELIQDVLAGILQVLPAVAIDWRPSGQFIDPQRYLQAYAGDDAQRFYAGAVNVRFYNISNQPGDMLMDTLGLAALGETDLQCHFRDLEPDDVAAVLGNTAYYLYQHGDVIQDGHTVAGVAPDSRWTCQREDSLLPPNRVVLDVDPGPPYAAGNRQREA